MARPIESDTFSFTSQSDPLSVVRHRLVRGILIATSIVGLPATIIACIEAGKFGQTGGMLLYGMLYLIVVAVTLFSRQLPFNLSAGVVLGGLYLIAIFNLSSFSFAGAGIELGITISVLATVLSGTQKGLITAAIFLVTLLAIGSGFIFGALDVSPNMPATTTETISWITAGSAFSLFSGTLIISSGMLQQHLIRALSSLKSNSEKLEKANADLTSEIKSRRETEARLVQSENRLTQAQKMESVGRLAGGVAHDYNNISSIIIGYSEFALEKVEKSAPLYEELMEIYTAAKRSTDITRQLLAFARQQTIAPKVLDLNNTIESMLKMLRRLIGEDIDLAWRPGMDVWQVKIDPSQIDQILANLCINARDAIADVGKVTIETENISFDEDYCADHAGFVPGEYVLLAVSDDGIGMARETLDKIFEPFFTTKGQGKGTGLGLATVYGIVKQNDGFINVYSEPDKGTSIKIYMPRHTGQGAEAFAEENMEIPLSQGSEVVLLVEDDASILKLGERILGNLGYMVLPANNPEKAIKLAEEHKGTIHLLLTDVVMPGMNGRELSEKLQGLYPDINTLFMSGYTANVIAHRGVLEDGINFISKPFSKMDLAGKVRKVLDAVKGETHE